LRTLLAACLLAGVAAGQESRTGILERKPSEWQRDEEGESAARRFQVLNQIVQEIRAQEARLLDDPRQPAVYARLVSLHRQGLDRTPLTALPRYRDLLEHVRSSLGWDADAFRGYRVRSDYPVYGSQITVAFQAPELSG
jgi:hypothetical protein